MTEIRPVLTGAWEDAVETGQRRRTCRSQQRRFDGHLRVSNLSILRRNASRRRWTRSVPRSTRCRSITGYQANLGVAEVRHDARKAFVVNIGDAPRAVATEQVKDDNL